MQCNKNENAGNNSTGKRELVHETDEQREGIAIPLHNQPEYVSAIEKVRRIEKQEKLLGEISSDLEDLMKLLSSIN